MSLYVGCVFYDFVEIALQVPYSKVCRKSADAYVVNSCCKLQHAFVLMTVTSLLT